MSNDNLHPAEPFCHHCHDGERPPLAAGLADLHAIVDGDDIDTEPPDEADGLRAQVAALTAERDRLQALLRRFLSDDPDNMVDWCPSCGVLFASVEIGEEEHDLECVSREPWFSGAADEAARAEEAP